MTLVLHGELRRINGARDRLYVYASEIMLHVVGRVHKTARMWPPVHRESKKGRKNARMLRSRFEWFPQANPVRGPCRAFRLIHVVAFGSEARSVELASLFLWAFVCMSWVLCVCWRNLLHRTYFRTNSFVTLWTNGEYEPKRK